jgi:SAM-dependent methyltransferase
MSKTVEELEGELEDLKKLLAEKAVVTPGDKSNGGKPKILKINIGSGPTRFDEWLNLDRNEADKPDYVSDFRQLPFESNSVDAIFASHVLEHTTLKEDVLKEWERVLKVDGIISIAVPDLLQGYSNYRAGIISLEYFLATVYGGKEIGYGPPEAQTHCQVFSADMLLERMKVYFRDVHLGATGSPRPACYGEVMAYGYKAKP